MGTLVRITVYAPDEEHARAAFRAGFDRIRDLDTVLSDYKPDSELNRIAKTAVARPTRVSDDLFTVLRASQDLAVATDGAFDITQGPVIQLWRQARAIEQNHTGGMRRPRQDRLSQGGTEQENQE